MGKITLPAPNVPLVDDARLVTKEWRDKFKFLEQLQPLSDIPAAATPVTSIDTATGAITLGYGLARTLQALRANITSISGALGGTVALNNVGSYFDGPSVAQGSTGTWLAMGTVLVVDTVAVATINAVLWDGSTVIASASTRSQNTAAGISMSLAGIITSPAGNLRISCNDATATTGAILHNQSGQAKDSHIVAIRLA